MSRERQVLDPRYYFQILAKRKWMVLALAATSLTLAVVQTLTTTPLFRTTAQIQIDPEDSNILPYEDLYTQAGDFGSREAYLQTQFEVLQSDTLALRTIERLNLADNEAFNRQRNYGLMLDTALHGLQPLKGLFQGDTLDESAQETNLLDRFLEDLEVTLLKGTRLVEVSFIAVEPELAQTVVNTLAEEFIEYNFESKYEATSRATEFLQKQLHELQINVEKSEEQLVSYARSKRILGMKEEQNSTLQLLAGLNEEMAKVKAQLIQETSRYEAFKGVTADTASEGLKTEEIVALEVRLSELQQNAASLSVQFLPDWPELVKVRREITEIKEQLREAKESALEQARLNYVLATDHYGRLSSALREQERLAERLREDSIQYNILEREVETNKQLYDGLLQRLKEAGVAAGLRSSNIHVVDRGRVPLEPHWPRTEMHLGLGLVMGLLLGVGFAFLFEHFDNTVKTPDDIENFLSLPALGVIPSLDIAAFNPETKLLTGGEESSAAATLLSFSEPRSRMWEAYRSLRTSILLSQSDKPPQKILITSAFASEGKTTTVANTGIVLAQTGARTIVIDLDMRRPALAGLLGVKASEGMSTYLSGNSKLSHQIRRTDVPNLYLLPAGPQPPNAAELIGSERMGRVFRLLEEDFDYIVIDSPPVLSVTDVQVVAREVDGVVLVVYGGKTPQEAVRKSIQNLKSVGGKVLGAMLNKLDISQSEYAYYYRYYYDNRYYVDTPS